MKKFLCITLVLLQQALSASPSIVFVHIGKEIPSYTETAVRQARLFNKQCDIYLVANEEAISQATDRYRDLPLQLIPCESLNKTAEHHAFIERSKLESGFWSHATERFLYLHDFITQYNLKDVFHLENDNMLYVDVETILPTCKQHYAQIGGTFDNDERFIGGMVYIHNTSSLQPLTRFLTDHAHEGRNEMEVIAQFKKEEGRGKIDHLPIIMSQYVDTHTLVSPAGHKAHDPYLYCNRIAEFDSIFDAAAIGQYIGGIVPINGRSVPGFINESCVFNPSLLTYTWQRDEEGRRVPYAVYEGRKYRINNLHIHSKRLYEYDSKEAERGSSYPYVSGDTFRAAADFVIDEMHLPFSPEKVQQGNTIFVKVDYVDHFFREIHPQINARYILITHNGDLGIPGSWTHMLDDDKLIAWFGQNCDSYIHPKLHPIPIGIANRCWEHGNVPTYDLMRKRLGALSKKRLLYMNFTIGTHVQERSMVYNMFADKPFCLASSPKSLKSYLIETRSSKFVLSPRGNGLDCHRTWEALYMGAIPIVRSSPADSMYEGLPVIIVQDWSEVTHEFLEQKYKEMSQKEYQRERMFADYWLDRIDSYKREKSHEEVFTQIHNDRVWGQNEQGEPISGGGSRLETTTSYREVLQQFLKDKNIKSVVDAGCGDWGFAHAIDWSGIEYKGYDVIRSIIDKNKRTFERDGIQFHHIDFMTGELPAADLLICKDVLQHLSNEDISRLISQFSKYKYCLITDDTGEVVNAAIKTGQYRAVDLTRPPFSMKGQSILSYKADNTKQVLLIVSQQNILE